MTSNEVKNKLYEINKEQHKIYPMVIRNIELEAMKRNLQHSCPHENSYLHSVETDSHEGRTYGHIICHDCMKEWEERIYMGKCKYSKWKYGDKW